MLDVIGTAAWSGTGISRFCVKFQQVFEESIWLLPECSFQLHAD
jgi:hypothetical protein